MDPTRSTAMARQATTTTRPNTFASAAPRAAERGHAEPAGSAGDPARLPAGWRHAAPVAWLLDHPRERREAILAGAFGLLAAIWAPIGILAFMARVFGIFLAVSLTLAVVLAVPRPRAVAQLTAAFREHVAPATRRLGPALRGARRELGAAVMHVRRELPGVVAAVREEIAPVAGRTRDAAASAMARVRRGATHTRRRLAELGPSPAQSSPRSAR